MPERVSYKDITLGAMLSDLARRLPEREALVYANRNLRWSFARLDAEATRAARALVAFGVEKGDRVAIWATNVPEWIVLMFALARIGAVLVTVNTALGRREVEYLLHQSESSTLFLISGFRGVSYVEALRDIRADAELLPCLERIVHIGEDRQPEMTPYRAFLALADLVPAAEVERRAAALDVDEVINMQYTSGTTGFPKGVTLSHRNILNNGSDIGDGLRYTPDDRLALTVPLFHCFGCVIGVLGAYTHGATLVPLESFEPERALEAVARERCTAIYGVPTMFIAELEHPSFARYDLSTLRAGVMAGSLCPMDLMRQVIDRMNLRDLIIAYGLTEASPVVTITSPDDSLERRTATVGRAMPGVEVRIVDPASGRDVSPGIQGELWTRGYHVMKGYYKDEAGTRAAITPDGWLRSGDLAARDAEGYVTITGRLKDMIIRGGENIYPKEIEEFLRTHPAVSDVAVYGVPNRKYGEEVAAAVKLKPGGSATREELVDYCRENISRFKVPKHLQFVDGFPLTASGKIQKYLLRERARFDFRLDNETETP